MVQALLRLLAQAWPLLQLLQHSHAGDEQLEKLCSAMNDNAVMCV